MCKECWSWYWGSSRNEASCIFTRSSSYTEYMNAGWLKCFIFNTETRSLLVFSPLSVWQSPWWSQRQGWWISSLSWKQENKVLPSMHKYAKKSWHFFKLMFQKIIYVILYLLTLRLIPHGLWLSSRNKGDLLFLLMGAEIEEKKIRTLHIMMQCELNNLKS